MEFFKANLNINFMGLRSITAVISAILLIAALAAILINGLKWGLDFTGGTQFEVAYADRVNISEVRQQLVAQGFRDPQVISYGTSREILISIAPRDELDQATMLTRLKEILPENAKVKRVEFIGPQVGKELAVKGILAIIVAMIGTMIYIALRFEYRFAVSAIIALIHDPLLIVGVFAFLQIDFDLKTLAALLAVIGYSLNDTIVVFDRVRENFRKLRRMSPIEVMNRSINQTLSRTIMTSVLTLMVVVALFVYGGETIRGFSLALTIGIVVGTYSSVYVAGSLAILLGLKREDLLPIAKDNLGEEP
ncbi:MAG: protein translocase subunit SecF [Gammaproteobacteria bacterium]